MKPTNKIKEYQTQEKLFSIVERVAEAYNVRRELRELELKEKDVVQQKIEKKNENQQILLQKKHVIIYIYIFFLPLKLYFCLLKKEN